MRVLLISASQPHVPCGVGDYTQRLAEALLSVGAEAVVLTTLDDRLEPLPPVPTIPIPTQWRLRDVPSLMRRIRRSQPDIVHLQYPAIGFGRGLGATFLPLAEELSGRWGRTAITLHEFRRFTPRVRRRIALGAAASRLVIVPNRDELDVVRRELPFAFRRRVISMPVASPLPVSVADLASAGREDELRIGFWGFMRPDKGLDDLVDAASLLQRTRRIRLMLLGDPGPDIEYQELIRRRTEMRGLLEVTEFGAWAPAQELADAIAALDICVLPYRDGLASNRGTYAAAVSQSTRIVTTSLVIRDPDRRTNTWFARPGDPETLAAAIAEAASQPVADVDRGPGWVALAEAHLEAYRLLLGA